MCWQNSWQKLDKWWHTTNDALTVYAASTLLAPRGKKAYFDQHWRDASFGKEKMITTVHKHWKKHYSDKQFSTDKPKVEIAPSLLDLQMNHSGNTTEKSTHDDVFMGYIHSAPVVGNVDLLYQVLAQPHSAI